MTAFPTRVAAYAVCFDRDRLLLARYVGPDGERHWTLPGGGVDFGEDPNDAVIREVFEQTGYHTRVDGSTDLAEWVPLDEVAGRERARIIDIALDLHRTHPADGHVAVPAVEGRLRH